MRGTACLRAHSLAPADGETMTSRDVSCSQCQRGSLILVGQAGRKVRIDGATIEVPRDFLIPTCDHCGVEQLDERWKASLAVAVANARVAASRSVRTEKMGIVAVPAARADSTI